MLRRDSNGNEQAAANVMKLFSCSQTSKPLGRTQMQDCLCVCVCVSICVSCKATTQKFVYFASVVADNSRADLRFAVVVKITIDASLKRQPKVIEVCLSLTLSLCVCMAVCVYK